ncbi:MAG: GNAT family N-acetyltransferase [Candidatus Dormibacterales bacterium]
MEINVRPARLSDLDAIRGIAGSYGNLDSWPSRPDYIDHELATGTLNVCEVEGEVVGFGGLLARGGVAHLGDLFVKRDRLGQGIGTAILDQTLPAAGCRVTFAAGDPRAVPLYLRFGMAPAGPLLYLKAPSAAARSLADSGVALRESAPADVAALDRIASGRERLQDLAFLAGHAHCFSAVRGTDVIGYGFVRLVHGAAIIGPSGGVTAEDSRLVGEALLRWSAERAASISISVFSPHALASALVASGFETVDVDTYMTTCPEAIDLERYVPSADLG